MLGLNRHPPAPDPRAVPKPALGRAPDPRAPVAPTNAATPPPDAPGGRTLAPGRRDGATRSTIARPPSAAASEAPPSKLFVGVNMELKGVAISDCDVLVVEGQVEATVSSKAMEVARPGSFTGTATIDVAEIHGEFAGEITARTRLVVHETGRVSGTVRYGKLVVAEGGEVNGDVRQLDAAPRAAAAVPPGSATRARCSRPATSATRAANGWRGCGTLNGGSLPIGGGRRRMPDAERSGSGPRGRKAFDRRPRRQRQAHAAATSRPSAAAISAAARVIASPGPHPSSRRRGPPARAVPRPSAVAGATAGRCRPPPECRRFLIVFEA